MLALVDYEKTNPDGELSATDERFTVEAVHSVTAVDDDRPATGLLEERNWFTGIANYEFETPKALIVNYTTDFQYSRPSPVDFPLRGSMTPFSASVFVYQRSPEVGYRYYNDENRIRIEVDEAQSFKEEYEDSARRVLEPGHFYIVASALTRAWAGNTYTNGLLTPFGTGMTSASSTSIDLRFLDVGDLVADDIEYVYGDTLAQDSIKLKYEIRAADLFEPVHVGLYWSTDGNFSSGLPRAGRWPASESGITSIPASSITPPSEAYRYLVMQLDDENRIEEPNESNNSQSLEIDPTFDIQSMEWIAAAEGGGLKVTYDVNQPAFLPANMTGSIEWVESGSTAHSNFSVSLDDFEPNFAGADFQAPSEGDSTIQLTITGAPTQISETLALEYVAPTVAFVLPQVALRKTPYDIRVNFTNNSPVPLRFDISWAEWDVSNGFLVRDVKTDKPLSGALNDPANRREITTYPGRMQELNIWGGPLNRTWDWIPAGEDERPIKNIWETFYSETNDANTGRAWGKAIELASELAARFISDVTLILDVYDSLQPPTPHYPLASIGYLIDYDPRVASVDKTVADQLINLKIPREREEDLVRYQTSILNVKLALTTATLAFESPPLALAALLTVPLSLDNAKQAYEQAIDPPDPDFTSIVSVANPNAIWDSLPTGYHRVDIGEAALKTALLNAMARTRDKSLGANLAGEIAWEARQRQVLSNLADRLLAIESRRLLSTTLQSAFLLANSNSWDAVKESVRSAGLPPDVKQQLENYGIDSDSINELAESIIQSSEQPFREEGSVLAGARLSALTNIQTAFNDFATSIRLKVTDGAAVMPGNSNGLDQKLAEIEEALERNLASEKLLTEIQRFIADAKERLNQSNDLEELQPFLESGYFALFSFQQLSVTPNALMDFIDRGVTEGRIASEVRDAAEGIASDASSLVVAGDMDGAVLKLGELATEIQGFDSSLLSEDDKTALLDFINLQKSLRFFNWHNHVTPPDVNVDGQVSPIDALLVINHLNSSGGGKRVPDAPSIHLLDTNNDSFVSPIDALLVINALNRSRIGEGEQTTESIQQVSFDQFPLSGFLENLPASSFAHGQKQRSALTNAYHRHQHTDYITSDQTTFSALANTFLSENFEASALVRHAAHRLRQSILYLQIVTLSLPVCFLTQTST